MRKLATIRIIDDIQPIDGADKIEVATVGGWKVVVKKNEFKVGDSALYFEIDSWIPFKIAPFLCRGKNPKIFNGVEGERLRTIRLRKQLSQGLLLPITFSEEEYKLLDSCGGFYAFTVEDDLDKFLNIQKWEKPMNAQLAGVCRGSFPSDIRKTDQERIQNLKKELREWQEQNVAWEVTEKLDGSSMTVYIKTVQDEEGNPKREFGVCSRNIDLKEDDNNAFWKEANRLGLRSKMEFFVDLDMALQGELIGEGIQGNPYNMKGTCFYLYDVFNIAEYRYLSPENRINVATAFGIQHVPVLDNNFYLTNYNMDDLLLYAEGKSVLNSNTEREGVVFKSHPQHREENFSFKAISNKFLMGEKE